MKLKRLTALLLAGVISFTVFPVYASENTHYTEAADRLYKLELLEALPENAELSQTITRGMAVKYVLPFCGVSAGEKGCDTEFYDVDKKHQYSQYIQAADQLDLIHGYNDGTFRPDEPITYIDALSIFVNALGYKDIAETYGDYPKGILAVAQNLEIMLSGSYINKESITVGDFLCIMDLAKDKDIAEALGDGMRVSFDRTDSILSDIHDIYYGEAIMTANEYTSLSEDEYPGENHVIIGNQRFDIGERAGNVSELLGYTVEYYYREEASGDVLLWAMADKKNNTITISSEKLVSYSDFVYSYYKTEGSSYVSKAELAEDADIIYNGRVNLHMQESLWIPENGEVILIDNDGDREYDVVKITDFQSMLVAAAFSETRVLRDKYTNLDLNFEDEALYEVICIKQGQRVSFDQIQENNALSIAMSSSDNSKILVTIYISDAVVEGTVSEYTVGDGEPDTVVIEDTSYKLTPYAKNNAGIGLKDTGSFYLDCNGYIVGSVLGYKTGLQYGYFIKALNNEDEDVLSLKILNTDGRIMYYDVSEKAKVNGAKESNENIISTLKVGIDGTVYEKCVGQPIKYALNPYGEITKLFTHNKTQSGDVSVQEERIRLINDFSAKGVTYYPTARTINMSCGVSEDAVAFCVPDVASQVAGLARDTDFVVEDVSAWKHTNGNRLQTFDDDDMGYCSLVLRVNILGGDTIDEKKDPYAMVDKITTTINDDEEIISVLHAYTNGKKIELRIEEGTALIGVDGASELTRGSIIEYNTLDNGKTGCVKLITTPDDFVPSDTYDGNRTRENVTVRGQVQRNNSDVLVISYEKSNGEYVHSYPAGASNMWFVPVTGGYIHVYDSDTDEIKVVSTLSDVKDYDHYGNNASLVMCQMTYMKVSNVFVIN